MKARLEGVLVQSEEACSTFFRKCLCKEQSLIIVTPLSVSFAEPLTALILFVDVQSSEICRYFTSQRVGTPQHWVALSFLHFRCMHWHRLLF